MEPQTCTAHVIDGRAEIWAPTQNGEGTLRAVARVLQIDPSAVKLSGWGRSRPGVFQGMAVVECYNSVSAQVVDLSIGEAGEAIVHRVSCAIDAVHVVNPGIVEAQMQGAVVYALGAALDGEITLRDGRV